MAQIPFPEGINGSQENEGVQKKAPSGRLKADHSQEIDEAKSELRDALSGILSACRSDTPSVIKNGDDFRLELDKVENQSNKEGLILLQVFRAFNKAKPELFPFIGELATILLTAFKNPDIRPRLSTELEGLSPELLLEIAHEKHEKEIKKEQRRATAEILGEMHPIRIKTLEELEQEIEKIANKSEAEVQILENLVKGIQEAKDASLFDLSRRILTAFYHTTNRPKISEALKNMTPSELQEIAVEMLGIVPKKVDTGRVSIDAVKQMLKTSTTVIPRPAASPSEEGEGDTSPRAKEEAVTRKIVTRTVISAVLNSGHLVMEMEKLLSEDLVTKESTAYELLNKIHTRLLELEKKNSKEKSEKIIRFEIALKDFAGKLIKTLRKSTPEKVLERFRILSKLLHHIGDQLGLLALIMTPKKAADINIIEEELKLNKVKLTRWTESDTRRLTRVRSYFENGEKTMVLSEDNKVDETRDERFRNALEDCSSLIVIGLSSSEKERGNSQFEEKINDLMEQIEVDAQGLEIKDLHDESTVIDATAAHVTEQAMDEEEKIRIGEALRAAQKHGMKEGLTKANRRERMNAAAEARKAKEAGLLDFGNVEDMLASALGE